MLLVVCLAPLLLSRESTPPARPALQPTPAARYPPARRPEWVLHDHFNLAALPVAVGLSAGSLCGAGGRTDLALTAYMLAYFTTDTLWIAARPAIVRTPRTLLFHHALTLLLLLHPLLYPPHRRYTAWMTIVELNTWLLVARRHFKRWRLALDTVFGITWILVRVMWFPIVPIYLACLAPEPWPPGALGQLTHACVVAITTVLAALQLVWTPQALAPMARWLWLSQARGAAPDDAAVGGKARSRWL